MSDRHYLARVLGLSVAPRVFTSVLTLVSLPILLRAVGATEYGIIVYLGAVIGVFESFADFGVSSAAGKMIADARVRRPRELAAEIIRWARLQSAMALLGALPVFGFSYVYVHYFGSKQVATPVLVCMAGATWVAIGSNFVRAGIRSCLDFKALMVIDTIESVTRSATWLVAARLMPTAFGVAIAALVTGSLVSMSGALIFVRVVRRQQQMIAATDANTSTGAAPLTHREMIRESLHFLGLRVSVRMTQAVPIVVIEKVAGAAVVGVIGAFARISELLGFPFAVIGNALSVRAQEVLLKDRRAIDALWDTVLRFLCVATAVAGGIVLVSVPLTAFLLPDDPAAAPLVAILSATIVTAAAAAMIGPMSDYIGALPKRVALITLIVLAEIPFLYAGGRFFGAIGAVAAYIVALLFTSVGFGIIAKRAFFGRDSYRPARDVMALLAVVMLAFAVALAAGLVAPPRWPAMWVAAVRAASYVLVLIAAILLTPSLRRTLLSGSLFDFTARAPSISAPGESELTPT